MNDPNVLKGLLTMTTPQAAAGNLKVSLRRLPVSFTSIFSNTFFIALLQALKKLGGAESLLSSLSSSAHDGIDASTIPTRTSIFGANYTPSPPPPTFLSLLIDSVVEDTTVQILLVSAVVSLAVGIYDDPETGWIEVRPSDELARPSLVTKTVGDRTFIEDTPPS